MIEKEEFLFIDWLLMHFKIHTVLLFITASDLCWVWSPFPTFPGFGSSLWRPSRGLLWIVRSFNSLWRILCPLDSPLRSPWLQATTTHFAQMCSPDAHYTALPGGVKDNLKTNGGASINTWSQDGQEAFPGLYIIVFNNKWIHCDP